MLRKSVSMFVLLAVSSISVYAASATNLDGNIDNAFASFQEEYNVVGIDKVLNDKMIESDPLSVYHKNLAQIKNPSYETLLPLLQKLSVYNKQFTSNNEAQSRDLAAKIAAPANAGWNTYRTIGITEIFNTYLPENQKDEQVALLEYNIKTNLIPMDQIANKQLLENMPLAENFLKNFNEFSAKMASVKQYSGKEIIAGFVPVIESYNDMVKAVPASAALVKTSVFRMPIACGWGRAQSVEELRDNLGIVWFASGDASKYRNAEDLQMTYKGLSQKDAAAFAKFVAGYYIWSGK